MRPLENLNLEINISVLVNRHGLSKVIDAVWSKCVAEKQTISHTLNDPNSNEATKWAIAAEAMRQSSIKIDALRI